MITYFYWSIVVFAALAAVYLFAVRFGNWKTVWGLLKMKKAPPISRIVLFSKTLFTRRGGGHIGPVGKRTWIAVPSKGGGATAVVPMMVLL